jgi:WD40 repeat protein
MHSGSAVTVAGLLKAHEHTVNSVAFSPDEQWLVTGGHDGKVRLWDLSAGRMSPKFVELQGHTAAVSSVATSPDGRWVASSSGDGTVRLWLLPLDELARHARRVAGRALTRSERFEYGLED